MLPIAVIVADRLVEHREKNPIFPAWAAPRKKFGIAGCPKRKAKILDQRC